MAYVFGSIWNRLNRNALNNLSKIVEQQGKSIQDLVAEGQLSPTQYAELITEINGLIKSGYVDKSELTPEFQEEIEGFNTQLAQKATKGYIALEDLNKNDFKFDGTWFSQDFINSLNNGTIEVAGLLPKSVTTEALADKSVTLSTLNLPLKILPKSFKFALQTPTNNRVESSPILLQKGDVITTSNSSLSFATYYMDGGSTIPSHTQGWQKNFVVEEDRLHVVRGRYDDNASVVNKNELFEADIFVEHDNMALEKSSFYTHLVDNFSKLEGVPDLEFLQGNISGADGTYTGVAMSGVSVVHLQLYEGESVRLKNTNDFQMALWVEGETSYNDGWNTTEYIAQTDKVISFMVRRNNSSRLDIEIAPSLIEYNSNQAFARRGDLANFSGSTSINNMIYPSYPVWGHEYLYSWYEKLRTNQAVKMTWAGDSTTNNSNMSVEFRRHSLGKKIMTLGGYDEALVTSINAGHGSQHTGNWLGGNKDPDKRTPNGFLDEDMLGNPDLYVFAYGFNDGSNSHFPSLSWQERIDRFEENLIEGLERIRGSQYNKSPDDMAIILCTPIAAYDSGRGNTPPVWNDKIRPIIQKACRDYNCAFVDITARQYDHEFSSSWSENGDWVHPKATANIDYMSMFEPLIFPRLLQN